MVNSEEHVNQSSEQLQSGTESSSIVPEKVNLDGKP